MPAAVIAEAQFTADDIIAHFAKQNEIAAKSAESESGGVVVNGRTGQKLNFQSGDGSGSGAQTVLSDGLVIPMTGAKRNIQLGAAASGPSVVAAAPSPGMSASGYDLSVTFELSSDRLTSQARTNLRQFAIALQTPALSGFRFAVEGHTDATGAADKNLELSERRAAFVSAVTHELRTPLTTFRMYAEMLAEKQTATRVIEPEPGKAIAVLQEV